jgi:hypothetical protein
MNKFVALENIKHFKALLKTEADAMKRKTLLELLAAEKEKLKPLLENAHIRPKTKL